MKRICFLTGTRADFGKIQSLLRIVNSSPDLDLDLFVTGMHLSPIHGSTFHEILKEGFKHVHVDTLSEEVLHGSMSLRLGQMITNFTQHIQESKPDMIVVHGDRIEAMAGALVAILNNIRLGHIEGGEITGALDDSLRHAISKLANEHFVSNEEAATCLERLGESKERIHIIGSPDLDAMEEAKHGNLEEVKKHYQIDFDRYGIALFHPDTNNLAHLKKDAQALVSALIESRKDWLVIYPNNDSGNEIILQEYQRFMGNPHFRILPSVRFEAFLLLLFNSEVMIGNSSAGTRETCVYGIPSIDIGLRQNGRYEESTSPSITHVPADRASILNAIHQVSSNNKRSPINHWGTGMAAEEFLSILSEEKFWNFSIQKKLPFKA